MNTQIELLKHKIAGIPDSGNERSFYPALCNFIEEYGKAALRLKSPQAVAEESLSKDDKNIGFPDITIRNGQNLIGWIEVKLPRDELDAEKFKVQFSKYKDSLENIVFTNLREWELWQWTKDEGESKIESKRVAKVSFDITKVNGTDSSEFENFLTKFFEGRAHETRTPKQLALALAKKTRLLSKQVEEALDTHGMESDLFKLKETFEKTLIQDISPHQFANMVSETLAYSLFLAALEHARRGNDIELTLTNAIDYLPTNVPILADLYSLVKKIATTIPSITDAARLLVDQLNASDIDRIRQKLVEHKPGEDPVIQFYEPFLKEYDPNEREARGVYYTPKPVVDFIIKSVDTLLKEKFGKAKGLAEESVHLLDPATGTGTFLMSAIQQIYFDTKKNNEAQGDAMVQRVFNDIVLNHILKHFYGFELLIAPYAVAHLKLTLEVERLGFDFALTKNDNDRDNDRFKIYLANTLDDPSKPPEKLFVGYDAIPQESEKARKVKSEAPILVITGNPPYSGISQNPVEKTVVENGKNRKIKTWIGDLIEDYKYTEGDRRTGVHFKERKHWLGDDYVKFIRFGQWKIDQHGEGVLALITNHSYLDNPTFRGMRWQLMNSFDEIYILNLHGNSKTEKTGPDGSKDENVFSIQQGVSISFFIKTKSSGNKKAVFSADMWGDRNLKFDKLLTESFASIAWKNLSPIAPYYFFIPKTNEGLEEYTNLPKITDIFPTNVTGIVTARDEFIIDFNKETLLERIRDFSNPANSDDDVRGKYFGNKKASKYLQGDTRGWKLGTARKKILNEDHVRNIKEILYRPFDSRYIYYHSKMVDWGREKIMNNFLAGPNLGLCFMRQVSLDESYSHFLVTDKMIDNRTFASVRGIIQLPPLYFYPSNEEHLFTGEVGNIPVARHPNIDLSIARQIASKIGRIYYPFAEYPTSDGYERLTPEDIFYYAYAFFHSPTYRSRYAEQLKIDFPRLPLTSDKILFAKLVKLGNELVNLHLLGENPLDKTKTIFDESDKWNTKVGGERTDDLDDWKVTEVRYSEKEQRVYVNPDQFFEGVSKDVWEFMVGGYQVCEKWLKDRKKAGRALSTDDLKHYIKIVVSLRETIRVMGEIDKAIPSWPIK